MSKQITADQAGCWLDGAMGWHNTWRVIDIALDHGWLEHSPETVASVRTDIDAYSGRASTDHDLYDRMHELATEATDYLQSLAPDGYLFVWDAGELVLMSTDDSEEWAWV